VLTGDDALTEVSGRYENRAYAYAVTIPSGLRAYKPKPPAPVHGIFIRLPAEGGDSRIDVNASYNTSDYKSVREASQAETGWFVKRCGGSIQTASNPSSLGSLPAVHTSITCLSGGASGSNPVLDGVVALRQATPDQTPGIIYSVVLTTTQQRYAEGRKVLEHVVRSFQLAEVKP
jgi:hypothetical protein